MIRKLLATTAIAGLFATGAFAQETAPAATSAAAAAPMASANAGAAAAPSNYLQSLSGEQHLASDLEGAEIYSGAGQDAQTLGTIRDWLVGEDGKVTHAIVEASVNDESRTVAVPFEEIQWSMGENNEPRATMTDANRLAQAPVFVEREQTAAATDPSMAGSTTAPAGSAASTGAMTPAPMTGEMAATAPAAGTAAPAAGTEMAAGGTAASGEQMMQTDSQYLTSSLLGQDIRTGTGDDAETIGEVNDLVVSDAGQVDAAVVGVGGFLGIGQKNVAVPFADFQVTRDQGAEPVFVLAATKEQLEQAPDFQGRDQSMASNAGTGTATGEMAATGAATGAAAGAAMGGAADQASTMASNAGTAMGNAADQAGSAMTGTAPAATTTAQNETTSPAAGTDAETTASTGGSMREGMTAVEGAAQLTADQLMGSTVYGPNDESIGRVSDIAMNAEGQVDAVIVDVGGFLGIGAKPVAVGLDNVNLMRDQGDSLYIYTQFSQDQLENAPAYDQASYAENRDTMRLGAAGTDATTPAAPAPAAGTATSN